MAPLQRQNVTARVHVRSPGEADLSLEYVARHKVVREAVSIHIIVRKNPQMPHYVQTEKPLVHSYDAVGDWRTYVYDNTGHRARPAGVRRRRPGQRRRGVPIKKGSPGVMCRKRRAPQGRRIRTTTTDAQATHGVESEMWRTSRVRRPQPSCPTVRGREIERRVSRSATPTAPHTLGQGTRSGSPATPLA